MLNMLRAKWSIFLISIIIFESSCTKSNVPKPPISDSSYVINSLSVFLGGDSTNWNVSTKNVFDFDSTQNQLIQTITESTYGDANPYSYQALYQYDESKRLKNIIYQRFQYTYQSMAFEYNGNGDIQKGLFVDLNGETIENEFSVSIQNGNTIITQYDTLASNIGKGQYVSNRPAIVKYTINEQGRVVRQYTISSELYNGRPAYEDTSDIQNIYDAGNHLTQRINQSVYFDQGTGGLEYVTDTTSYIHDGDSPAHVNDLAVATLRNLNWLTTSDYVNLFQNLSSVQYGNVNRDEPLISSYQSFPTVNYTANYQNTFDSLGLLQITTITTTERNTVNGGNTTRESHYFTYKKTTK